jgi:hypothetical protein
MGMGWGSIGRRQKHLGGEKKAALCCAMESVWMLGLQCNKRRSQETYEKKAAMATWLVWDSVRGAEMAFRTRVVAESWKRKPCVFCPKVSLPQM